MASKIQRGWYDLVGILISIINDRLGLVLESYVIDAVYATTICSLLSVTLLLIKQ